MPWAGTQVLAPDQPAPKDAKPTLRDARVGYSVSVESSISIRLAARHFPKLNIARETNQVTFWSNIDLTFRYRTVQGKSRVVVHQFDLRTHLQDLHGPQLSVTFRGGNYRAKVEGRGLRLNRPYGRSRKPEMTQATGKAFGSNFLPSSVLLDSNSRNEIQSYEIPVPLDHIFQIPIRDLQTELTNHVNYLGPLREEPRRAYLHTGSPFFEIGEKGEYAAQILSLERDDEVDYSPTVDQEPSKSTLIGAVNDAFARLGLKQPVDVRSESSVMYQILLGIDSSRKRKQVTIADVGFGVSQLLPIVVIGLRSAGSSLLLFEQPEIHLHPKLQANLADFFLALIKSGKRLLIETHSDHFINRLRRRIAEDSTDKLKDQVSILFAYPPHDDQGATIVPLQVDRYGVIENWPPDFLPESANEAEAIFRAGLEKRQRH